MPKKNPLNSGKPKALDFGMKPCYGNPERILWEHKKRATTHSADRTPADWVHNNVNTAGQMAKNVSKKSKECVDCNKLYQPTSNRQTRCLECKGDHEEKRTKAYMKAFHKERYVRRGYNQFGESNNNWKGGIGIFTRLVEKECCARCNSNKNLLIHHKDENRYNNATDNLEVLCKRCHQIQHRCWEALGVKLSEDKERQIKANCKV